MKEFSRLPAVAAVASLMVTSLLGCAKSTPSSGAATNGHGPGEHGPPSITAASSSDRPPAQATGAGAKSGIGAEDAGGPALSTSTSAASSTSGADGGSGTTEVGTDTTAAALASDPPEGIDPLLSEAIARALAPELPTAVQILSSRAYRGGTLVIAAIDEDARWAAVQGDDRSKVDAFADAAGACEEESSDFSVTECIVAAAPTPYVGWSRAGAPAHRLELAHLRGQGGDARTVIARRELIDLAVLYDVPDFDDIQLKLKPYDIDRDGHDEVLVIVPIARPIADPFTQVYGALAAIYDIRELRPQFTTSRIAIREYNHADDSVSEEITVRWTAKTAEGEVHPSLHVRERIRGDGRPGSDQTVVCPYSVVEDLWECPVPLSAGDERLKGDPLSF